MIQGGYIKNNTYFAKPGRLLRKRFIQNIVFFHSDILEYNIKAFQEEKDINTIRLVSHRYKLDNLDFLKEYDFSDIKAIDILSESVINIDGLYALNNLEEINSDNKNIDYSRFPKLKVIIAILSNYSYESFCKLTNLERIRLGKYKYDDLIPFSKNTNLKQLMLRTSKILSLKGLENFKQLELLELYQNRRIQSFEGITKEHNNTLKKIIVYSAPKLLYVNEYLSHLTNIEYLELTVKKIDSLRFLDKMPNLKYCAISNKLIQVEDGDIEPLIRALKRTGGKIW